MPNPAFRSEVSYDYLCPFAHIGHEHLVEALRGGAGWDVTFTPWTLRQVHKEEQAPDVWDDPARRDDLLAMEASIVIRDTWPEQFFDVHLTRCSAPGTIGASASSTRTTRSSGVLDRGRRRRGRDP